MHVDRARHAPLPRAVGADRDDPADLVLRVLQRVRDQLIQLGPADAHPYHQTVESRFSTSSTGSV